MHDAAGRCVQIAENGSTPSYSGNPIKNFIWCGAERCEQRDNSNAVVSQYSGLGQRNSSTNYFYVFDHLGSVREVTNNGGTVQGAFGFAPYGNMTVLSGSFKPDFGFTGIYQHSRTNLALTWFRQYNPSLGRWLSRDPLGEDAGLNMYGYAGNNPISLVDPLGLDIYFLNRKSDVLGAGHNAVLVGNDRAGYEFRSFRPENEAFGVYIPEYGLVGKGSVDKVHFNTLDEALKAANHAKYYRYIKYETCDADDQRALNEADNWFNGFPTYITPWHNSDDFAASVMRAGGIYAKTMLTPNDTFQWQRPNGFLNYGYFINNQRGVFGFTPPWK